MLPQGPGWACYSFRINGDEKDKEGDLRTEDVELWHRDPVALHQRIVQKLRIPGCAPLFSVQSV